MTLSKAVMLAAERSQSPDLWLMFVRRKGVYHVRLCFIYIMEMEVIRLWLHCKATEQKLMHSCAGAQWLLTPSCEFCLHQQPRGNYETGSFSESSAALFSVRSVQMWLQAKHWQMFGTFTHVGSVFLPLKNSEIDGRRSLMQPELFNAQLFIQSANYSFPLAAATRFHTQPELFYILQAFKHTSTCKSIFKKSVFQKILGIVLSVCCQKKKKVVG